MQTYQEQRLERSGYQLYPAGITSDSVGYLHAVDEDLTTSPIEGEVQAVLSDSLDGSTAASDEFWGAFSYAFSEGIEPQHPITTQVLQELYDEGILTPSMSSQQVAEIMHDRTMSLMATRHLSVPTFLNYEASVVCAHQQAQGLDDCTIEVGTGITWTTQYEAGLVLTDAAGPRYLEPGSRSWQPLDERDYSSYTFTGPAVSRRSQSTGLTPTEFESVHTYIQPDNPAVTSYLSQIFPQGTEGLSAEDILVAIYNHMIDDANFTYQRDVGDEWASVEDFLTSGVGDCEDFANAQASLSIAALEAAGFEDAASRIEVRAGRLMGPTSTLGHAFMTYVNADGQRIVLDTTDQRSLSSLQFPEGSDRFYDVMVEEYQFYLAVSFDASATQIHSADIIRSGFQTASFLALQSFITSQGLGSDLMGALTPGSAAVDTLLGATTATTTSRHTDPPTTTSESILRLLQDIDTLDHFATHWTPSGSTTTTPTSQASSSGLDSSSTGGSAFRDIERNTFRYSELGAFVSSHLRLGASSTYSGRDLSFLSGLTIRGQDAASYIMAGLHSPIRGTGEVARFRADNHTISGSTHSWVNSGRATLEFDDTSGGGGTGDDGLPGYATGTVNERLAFFFSDAAVEDYLTHISAAFTDAQKQAIIDEIVARGHASKDLDLDWRFPPRVLYDSVQNQFSAVSFSSVPSFRTNPIAAVSAALNNTGRFFDQKTSRLESGLTTRNLSQYVDQTQSGFAIYDYARINRDFTIAMDSLQYMTNVVDAIMGMSSIISKSASYIAEEDMHSAYAKIRRKLAGAIKKLGNTILAEQQQLINTFVTAWDKHNNATYKQFDQQITRKFKGFEFMLGNAFFANEWTIQELSFKRLLDQEMYAVTAAIREGFQRAQAPLQNLSDMRNSALFLANPDAIGVDLYGPRGPQAWADLMNRIEEDINVGRTITVGASVMSAVDYYFAPYASSVPGSSFDWSSMTESSSLAFFNDPETGALPTTTYTAANYKQSPAWQYFTQQAMPYFRVYDTVYREGMGNSELSRLVSTRGFNDQSFLDFTSHYNSHFESDSSYSLINGTSGTTSATSEDIRSWLITNNFLEANHFDAIDFARFENMDISGFLHTQGSTATFADIYAYLQGTGGILDSNGFVSALAISQVQTNGQLTRATGDISVNGRTINQEVYNLVLNYIEDRIYRLKGTTSSNRERSDIMLNQTSEAAFQALFAQSFSMGSASSTTINNVASTIYTSLTQTFHAEDEQYRLLDWDGRHVALGSTSGSDDFDEAWFWDISYSGRYVGERLESGRAATTTEIQSQMDSATSEIERQQDAAAQSLSQGTGITPTISYTAIDAHVLGTQSSLFLDADRAAMISAIQTVLPANGYTGDVSTPTLDALSTAQLNQLVTIGLTVGDIRSDSTVASHTTITFSGDQAAALISGSGVPSTYTGALSTINQFGYSTGLSTESYRFDSYGDLAQAASTQAVDSFNDEQYEALADGRRELERLIGVQAAADVAAETATATYTVAGTTYTGLQALKDAVVIGNISQTAAELAIQTRVNALAAAFDRTDLDNDAGDTGASSTGSLEELARASLTPSDYGMNQTQLDTLIRENLVKSTTASQFITDYASEVSDAYILAFRNQGGTPLGATTVINDDIPNGFANINASYVVSSTSGAASGRYETTALGVHTYTPSGATRTDQDDQRNATFDIMFNEFTRDREIQNEQLMLASGEEGGGREYQVMDYAAFAAIQKSIQIHSARTRLYYMYNDSFLSTLSTAVSMMDEFAIGVDGLSNEISVYDQRVALANLRYQQVMSKTSELSSYNNSYHQYSAQLYVEGDSALRSFSMISTWGGLIGGIMMLAAGGVDIAGAVIAGIASVAEVSEVVRRAVLKNETREIVKPEILQTIAATRNGGDATEAFSQLIDSNRSEYISRLDTFIDASVYNSTAVGTEVSAAMTAAGITISSSTSDEDIIAAVHSYINSNYDYVGETYDQWSSVSDTISRGTGDCEDLAFLEAAMLIRALETKSTGRGVSRIKLSLGEVRLTPSLILQNALVAGGYANAAGSKLLNLPATNPFPSLGLTDAQYAQIRADLNDGSINYSAYTQFPTVSTGGHVLVRYTDGDTQYALDPSLDGSFTTADTYNNYLTVYDYEEMVTASATDTQFLNGRVASDFYNFRTDFGIWSQVTGVQLPGMQLFSSFLPLETSGTWGISSMMNAVENLLFFNQLATLLEGMIPIPDFLPISLTDFISAAVRGMERTLGLDQFDIPYPPSDFLNWLLGQINTGINSITVTNATSFSSVSHSYNYMNQTSQHRGLSAGPTSAGDPIRTNPDPEMRNSMTMLNELAFQEKRVLDELFQLGFAGNMINADHHDKRKIIDWPLVHEKLERIEAIHYRMKLVYMAIKLKIDFLNKVSATVGDQPKRDVSQIADSVFNQQFEFTNNITGMLKQTFNAIQSNYIQNAGINSQRFLAFVDAVITPIFEIITTVINVLSVIPPFYFIKPFTVIWDVASELLKSILKFYIDQHSTRHNVHYEELDSRSRRSWRIDDGTMTSSSVDFWGRITQGDYTEHNPSSVSDIESLVRSRSSRNPGPTSIGGIDYDIFMEGRGYTMYSGAGLAPRGLGTSRYIPDLTAHSLFQLSDPVVRSSTSSSGFLGLFTSTTFTTWDARDAADSISRWNARMDLGDIVGAAAVNFDRTTFNSSFSFAGALSGLSQAERQQLLNYLASGRMPIQGGTQSFGADSITLTASQIAAIRSQRALFLRVFGLREDVLTSQLSNFEADILIDKLLNAHRHELQLGSLDLVTPGSTSATTISETRSVEIWRLMFETRPVQSVIDQRIDALLTHMGISNISGAARQGLYGLINGEAGMITPALFAQPNAGWTGESDATRREELYEGVLSAFGLSRGDGLPPLSIGDHDAGFRAANEIEVMYMNDVRAFYEDFSTTPPSGAIDLNINTTAFQSYMSTRMAKYTALESGITSLATLRSHIGWVGQSVSSSGGTFTISDGSTSIGLTTTQYNEFLLMDHPSELNVASYASAKGISLTAAQKTLISRFLNQQHLETRINNSRFTHDQRSDVLRFMTGTSASIARLGLRTLGESSVGSALSYDQANQVYMSLTGDLMYRVSSSTTIATEHHDEVERAAMELYRNPSARIELENNLSYSDRQAVLTEGYRMDTSTTGAYSYIVTRRFITAENRYLKTNYFDWATTYLQERMFAEMILEMYQSSRLAVMMALAQKVADGGLKQSANLATDFVQDASMSIMSHYSTQVGDIQNWHELKVSLHSQQFQNDKNYDLSVLLAIIFAIVAAVLSKIARLRKNPALMQGILQVVKSSIELLTSVLDAHAQKNHVDSGTTAETETEKESGERNEASVREQGGSEGAGYNFQTVDYRAKSRASLEVRQFTQAMKAMVTASKSEAELYMMLAEMLGGLTSKMTVSKGMNSMIETAKTTAMRIIDNRFKMQEAKVKRHNEKQDAAAKMMVNVFMLIIDIIALGITDEMTDKMAGKMSDGKRKQNFIKGLARRGYARNIVRIILESIQSDQLSDMHKEAGSEEAAKAEGEGEGSDADGDGNVDAGAQGIDSLMIGAEFAESQSKTLMAISRKLGEKNQSLAAALKQVFKMFVNAVMGIGKASSNSEGNSDAMSEAKQNTLDKLSESLDALEEAQDASKLDDAKEENAEKEDEEKDGDKDKNNPIAAFTSESSKAVADVKLMLGSRSQDAFQGSGRSKGGWSGVTSTLATIFGIRKSSRASGNMPSRDRLKFQGRRMNKFFKEAQKWVNESDKQKGAEFAETLSALQENLDATDMDGHSDLSLESGLEAVKLAKKLMNMSRDAAAQFKYADSGGLGIKSQGHMVRKVLFHGLTFGAFLNAELVTGRGTNRLDYSMADKTINSLGGMLGSVAEFEMKHSSQMPAGRKDQIQSNFENFKKMDQEDFSGKATEKMAQAKSFNFRFRDDDKYEKEMVRLLQSNDTLSQKQAFRIMSSRFNTELRASKSSKSDAKMLNKIFKRATETPEAQMRLAKSYFDFAKSSAKVKPRTLLEMVKKTDEEVFQSPEAARMARDLADSTQGIMPVQRRFGYFKSDSVYKNKSVFKSQIESMTKKFNDDTVDSKQRLTMAISIIELGLSSRIRRPGSDEDMDVAKKSLAGLSKLTVKAAIEDVTSRTGVGDVRRLMKIEALRSDIVPDMPQPAKAVQKALNNVSDAYRAERFRGGIGPKPEDFDERRASDLADATGKAISVAQARDVIAAMDEAEGDTIAKMVDDVMASDATENMNPRELDAVNRVVRAAMRDVVGTGTGSNFVQKLDPVDNNVARVQAMDTQADVVATIDQPDAPLTTAGGQTVDVPEFLSGQGVFGPQFANDVAGLVRTNPDAGFITSISTGTVDMSDDSASLIKSGASLEEVASLQEGFEVLKCMVLGSDAFEGRLQKMEAEIANHQDKVQTGNPAEQALAQKALDDLMPQFNMLRSLGADFSQAADFYGPAAQEAIAQVGNPSSQQVEAAIAEILSGMNDPTKAAMLVGMITQGVTFADGVDFSPVDTTLQSLDGGSLIRSVDSQVLKSVVLDQVEKGTFSQTFSTLLLAHPEFAGTVRETINTAFEMFSKTGQPTKPFLNALATLNADLANQGPQGELLQSFMMDKEMVSSLELTQADFANLTPRMLTTSVTVANQLLVAYGNDPSKLTEVFDKLSKKEIPLFARHIREMYVSDAFQGSEANVANFVREVLVGAGQEDMAAIFFPDTQATPMGYGAHFAEVGEFVADFAAGGDLDSLLENMREQSPTVLAQYVDTAYLTGNLPDVGPEVIESLLNQLLMKTGYVDGYVQELGEMPNTDVPLFHTLNDRSGEFSASQGDMGVVVDTLNLLSVTTRTADGSPIGYEGMPRLLNAALLTGAITEDFFDAAMTQILQQVGGFSRSVYAVEEIRLGTNIEASIKDLSSLELANVLQDRLTQLGAPVIEVSDIRDTRTDVKIQDYPHWYNDAAPTEMVELANLRAKLLEASHNRTEYSRDAQVLLENALIKVNRDIHTMFEGFLERGERSPFTKNNELTALMVMHFPHLLRGDDGQISFDSLSPDFNSQNIESVMRAVNHFATYLPKLAETRTGLTAKSQEMLGYRDLALQLLSQMPDSDLSVGQLGIKTAYGFVTNAMTYDPTVVGGKPAPDTGPGSNMSADDLLRELNSRPAGQRGLENIDFSSMQNPAALLSRVRNPSVSEVMVVLENFADSYEYTDNLGPEAQSVIKWAASVQPEALTAALTQVMTMATPEHPDPVFLHAFDDPAFRESLMPLMKFRPDAVSRFLDAVDSTSGLSENTQTALLNLLVGSLHQHPNDYQKVSLLIANYPKANELATDLLMQPDAGALRTAGAVGAPISNIATSAEIGGILEREINQAAQNKLKTMMIMMGMDTFDKNGRPMESRYDLYRSMNAQIVRADETTRNNYLTAITAQLNNGTFSGPDRSTVQGEIETRLLQMQTTLMMLTFAELTVTPPPNEDGAADLDSLGGPDGDTDSMTGPMDPDDILEAGMVPYDVELEEDPSVDLQTQTSLLVDNLKTKMSANNLSLYALNFDVTAVGVAKNWGSKDLQADYTAQLAHFKYLDEALDAAQKDILSDYHKPNVKFETDPVPQIKAMAIQRIREKVAVKALEIAVQLDTGAKEGDLRPFLEALNLNPLEFGLTQTLDDDGNMVFDDEARMDKDKLDKFRAALMTIFVSREGVDRGSRKFTQARYNVDIGPYDATLSSSHLSSYRSTYLHADNLDGLTGREQTSRQMGRRSLSSRHDAVLSSIREANRHTKKQVDVALGRLSSRLVTEGDLGRIFGTGPMPLDDISTAVERVDAAMRTHGEPGGGYVLQQYMQFMSVGTNQTLGNLQKFQQFLEKIPENEVVASMPEYTVAIQELATMVAKLDPTQRATADFLTSPFKAVREAVINAQPVGMEDRIQSSMSLMAQQRFVEVGKEIFGLTITGTDFTRKEAMMTPGNLDKVESEFRASVGFALQTSSSVSSGHLVEHITAEITKSIELLSGKGAFKLNEFEAAATLRRLDVLQDLMSHPDVVSDLADGKEKQEDLMFAISNAAFDILALTDFKPLTSAECAMCERLLTHLGKVERSYVINDKPKVALEAFQDKFGASALKFLPNPAVCPNYSSTVVNQLIDGASDSEQALKLLAGNPTRARIHKEIQQTLKSGINLGLYFAEQKTIFDRYYSVQGFDDFEQFQAYFLKAAVTLDPFKVLNYAMSDKNEAVATNLMTALDDNDLQALAELVTAKPDFLSRTKESKQIMKFFKSGLEQERVEGDGDKVKSTNKFPERFNVAIKFIAQVHNEGDAHWVSKGFYDGKIENWFDPPQEILFQKDLMPFLMEQFLRLREAGNRDIFQTMDKHLRLIDEEIASIESSMTDIDVEDGDTEILEMENVDQERLDRMKELRLEAVDTYLFKEYRAIKLKSMWIESDETTSVVSDRHASKRLRQRLFREIMSPGYRDGDDIGPPQEMNTDHPGTARFFSILDLKYPRTDASVTNPSKTDIENDRKRDAYLAYFVKATLSKSYHEGPLMALLETPGISARDKAALLVDKHMMLGLNNSLRYDATSSGTYDLPHFLRMMQNVPKDEKLAVLTSMNDILGTSVFARVFRPMLDETSKMYKGLHRHIGVNGKDAETFVNFVKQASGITVAPSVDLKTNVIPFTYVVRHATDEANDITKKYYGRDDTSIDTIDAITVENFLEFDNEAYGRNL